MDIRTNQPAQDENPFKMAKFQSFMSPKKFQGLDQLRSQYGSQITKPEKVSSTQIGQKIQRVGRKQSNLTAQKQVDIDDDGEDVPCEIRSPIRFSHVGAVRDIIRASNFIERKSLPADFNSRNKVNQKMSSLPSRSSKGQVQTQKPCVSPPNTILIERLIKNYNVSTAKNLGEYVQQNRALSNKRKSRVQTPNAFKSAKVQPALKSRKTFQAVAPKKSNVEFNLGNQYQSQINLGNQYQSQIMSNHDILSNIDYKDNRAYATAIQSKEKSLNSISFHSMRSESNHSIYRTSKKSTPRRSRSKRIVQRHAGNFFEAIEKVYDTQKCGTKLDKVLRHVQPRSLYVRHQSGPSHKIQPAKSNDFSFSLLNKQQTPLFPSRKQSNNSLSKSCSAQKKKVDLDTQLVVLDMCLNTPSTAVKSPEDKKVVTPKVDIDIPDECSDDEIRFRSPCTFSENLLSQRSGLRRSRADRASRKSMTGLSIGTHNTPF